VALYEPESPYIAFNIWVQAGSQNDPAGKEGLAALTAALLSDGATTVDSYNQILEKLYPMAAGYGYNVDKEMTAFTGRIYQDNLDAYYELFRNHLLKPAFDEADFERVKSQLMNYLERTRRYGRDEELTKELLFYAKYYVSNNIVIGVGGGFPDGFAARVREDFNTLPEGEVALVPEPQPRAPDGIRVLIVDKPTDATPISIGYPLDFVRGEPDYFPMFATATWFGQHRNSFSHLYQVIREKRGMNYGDYAYIEAFPRGYTTQQPRVNCSRRSHLFEIWIRPISMTEPGNLHDRTLFATRAALLELEKLVDDGLVEENLATTQQFLRNFTVNWGNTISRRLAYAMDDRFYGIGGDGYLASIRPALAGLDLAGVNRAVSGNLQYEDMYIVMITRDAEGMKEKLLSGVATPITYSSEKSAEHMVEDAEIAGFPIPVQAENITIIGINDVFESGPPIQ
jgi:zinc protease